MREDVKLLHIRSGHFYPQNFQFRRSKIRVRRALKSKHSLSVCGHSTCGSPLHEPTPTPPIPISISSGSTLPIGTPPVDDAYTSNGRTGASNTPSEKDDGPPDSIYNMTNYSVYRPKAENLATNNTVNNTDACPLIILKETLLSDPRPTPIQQRHTLPDSDPDAIPGTQPPVTPGAQIAAKRDLSPRRLPPCYSFRAASACKSNITRRTAPRPSSTPPQISIDPLNPPLSKQSRELWGYYDETWQKYYDKGVELWNDLRDAQINLRDDQCPNLAPDWLIQDVADPIGKLEAKSPRKCHTGGILKFVDDEENPGRPLDEKICTAASYEYILESPLKSWRGRTPRYTRYFVYDNWFSATAGHIAAEFNTGRIDPRMVYGLPHQGRLVPVSEWPAAPNRWAEIAFAGYNNVCAQQQRALTSLRFISQLNIANGETRKVVIEISEKVPSELHHAWDDARDNGFPNAYHWEFDSSDPNFYALLGTPNGVGAVKLLTLYAGSFATRDQNRRRIAQVKSIGRVRLLYKPADTQLPKTTDMLFILRDDDLPSNFRGQYSEPLPPQPWHLVNIFPALDDESSSTEDFVIHEELE